MGTGLPPGQPDSKATSVRTSRLSHCPFRTKRDIKGPATDALPLGGVLQRSRASASSPGAVCSPSPVCILSLLFLLPLCLGLCLLVFLTVLLSQCSSLPCLLPPPSLPQVPCNPPPVHSSLSAQSFPGFLFRAIPCFAEAGARPHQPWPA